MDRTEKRIFDAFMERLEEELPNQENSQKAAFHKVNDEFEAVIRFKPYKSYDSFRIVKSRYKRR